MGQPYVGEIRMFAGNFEPEPAQGALEVAAGKIKEQNTPSNRYPQVLKRHSPHSSLFVGNPARWFCGT